MLNFNEIYKELTNYIKFASKQVFLQNKNTVVSAEDLYQEGLLLLCECFKKYSDKDKTEFLTIFKTSLWRKLRDICFKKSCVCLDLELAYDLGYTQDIVNDIYEEYKLKQIAELLKDDIIALTILKEFINPSKRTIWEAQMELNRKEMLKLQGSRNTAPRMVKIKSTHIKNAMGIKGTEFKKSYDLVKTMVSKVYRGNGNFENVIKNVSNF